MKKFMKTCAILAAIMLTLGIVMALAAGTVRGSAMISEVVESVTGGRLHVNIGNWKLPWGIFLNDGWLYDLDSSKVYDGSHAVMRGDVDEYSLGSDVQSLEIEIGGYYFKTAVSPDDSFYLSTENADKFQCYVESGVLYLNAVNAGIIHFGSANRKIITLYIPEGQYFREVELELGAGQATLENLDAGQASMEVGAGQVIAQNIRVGELGISVGAGQMKLSGIQVDVLEAEVGMGEFVGSGSIQRKASLECGMGNMELKLAGRQQDFNYRLEVAAGNLTLGASSYGGLAQEQNIQNGADKDLEIECAMGNVTISFSE